MSTRGAGRTERGAAAVEAGLVISFFLIPLVLGIISYGSYFWQAQKVEPLSSRLPLQNIVGTFNCAQLIDRVKTTVKNALPSITGLVDSDLPLSAIGVTVVDALPTVGVDVSVSIGLQTSFDLGGLVPLPNGGKLLSEATYRLDNVKLTTAGC
ncbi:hypothetical protein ACVW00_002629 [Marmoricola sp. URHA0025 HA25]